MKRSFSDIFITTGALLILLNTGGCRGAGADVPDEPRGGDRPAVRAEMRAGFAITVSDTSGDGATRAPGFLGDGYDTGAGYENYIDLEHSDFRFYFFDDTNRYVAALTVDAIYPLAVAPGSKTYYVDGYTKLDLSGRRLKVVALANWKSYPADTELKPGETTIADLCGQQYDYSPAGMLPSASNTIPLFGIGKEQTLSFDALDHADLGLIHLLRAYAKVEVIKDPECPIDIEWAKIVRYNTGGFCAPEGVNSEADYVHGSYEMDYVNTPHIPTGCESAGEIEMRPTDTGSLIAYVPEYANLTGGVPRAASERTVIHVRFAGNPDAYDTVEFKDYTSGTHFDVLRNYWYKFTLSKLSEPMVQMVPYNEVDLRPGFGLIIGPNFVPVLDDDGNTVYWYDPDSGKYYGTDKKTEVPDPYISEDPVTHWSLVRDDNNRFFCYHDIVSGKFYATDKTTEIRNPFEYVTMLKTTVTDWQGNETEVEVQCNRIIDAVTDKLYYYYDRANSVWFRPDGTALGTDELPDYR